MWAEWGKTTLQPSFMRPVFWPALRGNAPDEKALAAFERNLDILEDRLGDGPWLLGRDFTLADIEAGLPLYRYFTVEIARRDRPALAAYYARLGERPAYAEHVMVPYDILRQMPS
jgi:glutathione S-transferase